MRHSPSGCDISLPCFDDAGAHAWIKDAEAADKRAQHSSSVSASGEAYNADFCAGLIVVTKPLVRISDVFPESMAQGTVV